MAGKGQSSIAAWLGAIPAALALAASPLGASTVPAEDPVAGRLLAAHNRERERIGMPRLEWSAVLAAQARSWAEAVVRTRRFGHASDRSGAGENLWMGTAGYYSAEAMIGSFVAESRDFRPGQFPNVSRTGNWADVGHYTQLIWPGTREVGCALVRGAADEVLVCRYWPAGNVYGQRVP